MQLVVALLLCTYMLIQCDLVFFFFFQAEDGIRDKLVTGVQTCALPICPNTPPGTKVDANGCPVSNEVVRAQPGDEDGDGVPDTLDKCPHTPAGAKVDAQGCIILFQPQPAGLPQPGAPARPTLILLGVTFATAQSALKPQSYVVQDEAAPSP